MKYSVTRENRGGSNVRQSSRAFLATLWHSIPNTFSKIFLFSDFSPLLVNIENSLIVNNFLPPTFEINQVTIFIDFSKNIHNRNTSFPSFYTIQTTHLDAVRFLDSEHLAVLLRRCYSHHIRRAVLPDRKTLLAPKKKKEVGWFFFFWAFSLPSLGRGNLSMDGSPIKRQRRSLFSFSFLLNFALRSLSLSFSFLESSSYSCSCSPFETSMTARRRRQRQQRRRGYDDTTKERRIPLGKSALDEAYERMRLRGGLPPHINVASLHRRLMPGSGVPPPHPRFGWSIGCNHHQLLRRRHHHHRHRRPRLFEHRRSSTDRADLLSEHHEVFPRFPCPLLLVVDNVTIFSRVNL